MNRRGAARTYHMYLYWGEQKSVYSVSSLLSCKLCFLGREDFDVPAICSAQNGRCAACCLSRRYAFVHFSDTVEYRPIRYVTIGHKLKALAYTCS